jgi:hypothetical protein
MSGEAAEALVGVRDAVDAGAAWVSASPAATERGEQDVPEQRGGGPSPVTVPKGLGDAPTKPGAPAAPGRRHAHRVFGCDARAIAGR